MTTIHRAIRAFCSYSHRDEEFLKQLNVRLTVLKRRGLIDDWNDRKIGAGQEWREAIEENLKAADVVLLLVSDDFMASEFAYEEEMGRAIERDERGEALVIPIIVRPAIWRAPPLDKLQALPKDAKAITTWPNQDEAWVDVATGIQQAVEKLADKLSKHEQVSDELSNLTRRASDEITHRSREEFQVRLPAEGRSSTLAELPRHRIEERALRSKAQPYGEIESIQAKRGFEKSGALPGSGPPLMSPEAYNLIVADTLIDKAQALQVEGRLEEAVGAYDQALGFNTNDPVVWYRKGLVLASLEYHDEALDAFREADMKRRGYPEAWNRRETTLGNGSQTNEET